MSDLTKGQQLIKEGRYEDAIALFSSIIAAQPRNVGAYRGRAEAKLMLGRFADAFSDIYARLIAAVQPQNIDDLCDDILSDYKKKDLTGHKAELPALACASLTHWAYFHYDRSLPLLEALLKRDPDSVYGNLFRGSCRMFLKKDVDAGKADIERALRGAPQNAQVRHIVADAYTYAQPPDPDRAIAEANLALEGGENTPRVHGILAVAHLKKGDHAGAAVHFQKHIDLVTTKDAKTTYLVAGSPRTIQLVPGRTYHIPIQATAGETIKVSTGSTSSQIWDTILVLLSPAGRPITGSDDMEGYFAGLNFVAPETGTYQMRVTSFEGIYTGPVTVTRS